MPTDEREAVARAGLPALVGAVAMGTVLVGSSVWLYGTSPYSHQFGLPCPFLASTGWYCPGCGATRSFYSLLHGDISTALTMNALLVVCVVPLALWGVWAVAHSLRGHAVAVPRHPEAWTVALLVVFALFTVARNLGSAAPLLSP